MSRELLTDEHGIVYWRDEFLNYTDAKPKPIYCVGCQDEEVSHAGAVCLTCRNSDPSDWVLPEFYEEMRRLAKLEDQCVTTKA